jgi:hypothetical protein
MTALQWIVKEAKKIKKEYPKRFAKWTDYVAQASAIYAKKHKGHSPVGKKKKAKVGYSKLRLKTDKELTKTIKNQPKELFPYTKKQELIRAGKKYFDDMAKNIHKVSGVKNKKVKKSPARSLHKDTKSHNVNIRVMSGISDSIIHTIKEYDKKRDNHEKQYKFWKENAKKYGKVKNNPSLKYAREHKNLVTYYTKQIGKLRLKIK